jgi:nucleoside-diphosphate-sugar epimerase
METFSTPLKVLTTGAYGLIGNLVYAHLAAQPERYDAYGSARRLQPSVRVQTMPFTPIPEEKMRLADISDFEAVQQMAAGMDVIVHMAASPDGNAPWETVLQSNIIGSYNIFEASRLAGVKRVVYASTNMVVFGYMGDPFYQSAFANGFENIPADAWPTIRHDQPTRSTTYYASSKVFGESLAHMYAHVHKMSCLVIRIGWVTDDDKPSGRGGRLLWCSHRDIIQLVERCINAPDSLRFDVFFGQSNNPYNFVDIQHPRDVLGYEPQDSAEDYL